MKHRLQFATGLLALGCGAAMAVPSLAQRGRPNAQAQHRPAPPSQPRRADRPPQRQPERNARQERRQEGGQGNTVVPRPNNNPNRPPSSYTPPPAPQRKFGELSPKDKQRVLEDNRKYENLTPAQRQEIQERKRVWDALTPQQQNHIKNEVLPKWKDMPSERRQAIRQRLRILQNMPESARNQRLNDPNFTRGMSEDDKATLRDLSHMHVGAPDNPPGE